MTTLVERLNAAIEAKGLSRRGLAKLAGVHPNTLNGWFSGATKNPQEDQLQVVAKVLGVTYEWLRAGSGPMNVSISIATGSGKSSTAMTVALGQILVAAMTPGCGARIKKAREEADLSPLAAAERFQISKKRLAQLEKEEEEPTPMELMAIAMETGTNIRWIATGRSLPTNDEAHETVTSFREPPAFDRRLLARALRAALSAGPNASPERLVDATIDAYELASKPGRSEKVEELVKALLL